MVDFSNINGTALKSNTTNSNITTGELGSLSNDDFMKLFLSELKFQDPLEPMDASKMLDSTLQMSTIESNTKQTSTLDEISKSLNNPEQSSYINIIDKSILIDNNNTKISAGAGSFMVDMPEDFEGKIFLKDENDNVIQTQDIKGKSGINHINFSNVSTDGIFKVQIEAINNNKNSIDFNQNKFKVLGLKMSNGKPEFKVDDGIYIKNDNILEYTI